MLLADAAPPLPVLIVGTLAGYSTVHVCIHEHTYLLYIHTFIWVPTHMLNDFC